MVIPAGYAVRLAELRDVPFLNDIEMAAATIFPIGTLPDHMREDRLPRKTLLTAQAQKLLWVAIDAHNAPVGYLLLQLIADTALLAQIDVHPRHGRKGLGKALISAAVRRVRRMDVADLYLTTFSGIAWNAPFYATLGFSPVDEAQLPDVIHKILRQERRHGMRDRIAMKLPLRA